VRRLMLDDSFIFGGTISSAPDQVTATTLSTVYILTLPIFVRIETLVVASTSRAYHTCSLVLNRQMISIGGVRGSGATWPDWDGLYILNMTKLAWTDTYILGVAAYQPPTLVIEHYRSNNRYPTWEDTKLGRIFHDNGQAVPFSSPSPSFSPANSSSSCKSNARAIDGGVVGGIAVIIVIRSLLF
jgi:hypothetical protein